MTAGPGTARASLHGVCRVCGIRDDLNNDDQGWCRGCWLELDAWAGPNRPPPRLRMPWDRANDKEVVVETGLPFERLYTNPRSRPTRATRRTWQRRPWMETPIGHKFHRRRAGPENVPSWARGSLHYDRHGVSRIDVLNAGLHSDAPYRHDGVHHDGLVLRCLICLGAPEAPRPRHDHEVRNSRAGLEKQSCEACDQAWRRAGRPWFDAFDTFVEKRRREYLQANPAAQLFALTRLKLPSDQAKDPDSVPVTRANDNDVVCNGYNRDIGGNETRRLALGLSVPFGWRRDDADPGQLVPELTLEMWVAAQPRRHLQSTPSCPSERLATITDIDTHKRAASAS